ncbi:MAG: radical SAM protein [Spirochaetaceae bacterium]|nr:MAG: radical SAM protein [Spirochaetaceae bacterium]
MIHKRANNLYTESMQVSFVCIHIERSSRSVPLGAAMVASALRAAFPETISVEVVDAYLEEASKIQLDRIMATRPDYIGFSIYLWNTEASINLIRELKAQLPQVRIMVGGPHPSALPAYFAGIPEIDYVFTGEAEASIVNFFASKTKPENKTIHPSCPPELDQLPSPYLDGVLQAKNYSGLLWEFSRGCPFRCAFCYEARGSKQLRRFPLERLQQELAAFQQAGVNEIMVLDPTFNYNPIQAKELLRMLIDSEADIHWNFEIRAEYLDEEMAALFSMLPCSVQIGLQSTELPVLKRVNRSFNPELFFDKLLLLHETGTPYGLDLMYGLPTDSLQGFLRSLDFAFSVVPNHIDIFPLTILPGTPLADQSAQGTVETWSAVEMQAAAGISRTVDIFYNQGKAVSWLDIMLSNLETSASEFFDMLASEPLLQAITDPRQFQTQAISTACKKLDLMEYEALVQTLAQYFWQINNLDFTGPTIQEYKHDPLIIIACLEDGTSDFDSILPMLTASPTWLAISEDEGSISHRLCNQSEYQDFLTQKKS